MSANFFEMVRGALAAPDLALTGRLANILVLSDVEPGDNVVVQAAKTREHLLLYLAVLRAGAVYVPVDAGVPLPELEPVIAAARPKVVVCDPAQRDGLAPIAEKCGVSAVQTLDAHGAGMLTESAAKAPSEFADVPREEVDLASVYGGTKLTHRELAARGKALINEGSWLDVLTQRRN